MLVVVTLPDGAGFGYRPAFVPAFSDFPDGGRPEDKDITTGSVNPGLNLRVALVRKDGALVLANFGEPEPDVVLDIAAVGVAWSNGGDRLAVVTQDDPNATDVQLRIFTPNLEPLASFPSQLAARPEGLLEWRYIVSWNADDTLVAVSTDITFGLNFEPRSYPRRALIIRPDDGAVVAHELDSVYFIGADTVIAPAGVIDSLSRSSANDFRVLRLLPDGGLEEQGRIQGPRFIVGSDASSGVFATIESEFLSVVPVTIPPRPIALRTTTRGPQIIEESSAAFDQLIIQFVRVDLARPVLDALAAEGGMP